MAVPMDRRFECGPDKTIRLAGLAGCASLVLGAAGVAVDRMWTFPGTGATSAEIATYAQSHRTALLVAMVLTTAAVALWLAFGAGVWLWLRQTTNAESVLSACFLAGLISFVTLLLAGFTPFLLLVYRAPEASDPRLLYDLSFALLAISGIPTALALGSYAAIAFGAERIPGSTAVLAVLAALAHVVLFASLLIGSGFFSLEGGVTIAIPATLFAWIFVTSIAMIAAARPEASAGRSA